MDTENVESCEETFNTYGKAFVMDYEGHTFVFFIKKNKQDHFIKM